MRREERTVGRISNDLNEKIWVHYKGTRDHIRNPLRMIIQPTVRASEKERQVHVWKLDLRPANAETVVKAPGNVFSKATVDLFESNVSCIKKKTRSIA